MALQTDLSRSPYYDDFSSDKNFYRVLYRPGTAVQTRELNQMQTILQDQLDKFGRHIFTEGSVIEGCAFTFDNSYDYVKLSDTYANGYAFTISDFQDKFVYNSNGLKGVINNTYVGYSSQDPDLNTLYIKYLNVGTYPNSSPQKLFTNNEILTISANSESANTTAIVGKVTVATVANSTGKGYAFTTTSGVIFQKGFFVNVRPQTLIVSKYSNSPTDVSVGFDSVENIVTPESDASLLDNAAGAPNYAAPGAHRLQLVPTLITTQTSELASNTKFFSLVDFKDGVPVTIRNTPEYNILGKQLAQRTYETNGNFIVSPFLLSTDTKIDTDALYHDYVNLASSRGLGYVEGYRVEFLNNMRVPLRKGVDTEIVEGQIVSANYGNYVYVKEFVGDFDTEHLADVELHKVAKTAISSRSFLGVTNSSTTKIGTASVKAVQYDSGTIGSNGAQYKLYIFGVYMNPGESFTNVRSIIRYSSSVKAVADIILTRNATLGTDIAVVEEPKLGTLIFPLGQQAVKSDGFSGTQYVYRNSNNSTIQTNGVATVGLPAVTGSGTESFNVSGAPLSDKEALTFLIIPTANGQTANKTGTVAATTGTKIITGTGTTFDTNYRSGDFIKINNEIHAVDFVANGTSMTVKENFASSPAANVHAKFFVSGVPIDYTQPNRNIGVSGSTATLTLGETLASGTTLQTIIYHDILRKNTVAIKKNITRNAFVKINCATHSNGKTGPWSLGVPDVFQINGIYISADGNYANSTTASDSSSLFYFNNGQRDNIYGHGNISNKNVAVNSLTDASTLFIDFDVFTQTRSQGVGFFTANSYPIDDYHTSNNFAITTYQIPKYVSTSSAVYDLRDCVDFRPYVSNTAAIVQSAYLANVNPSFLSPVTIDLLASGSYIPTNDTNWQSNVEHYLPRKDLVVIDTKGRMKIIEGISANLPKPPVKPAGVMTLGTVNIPPYPSLTPKQAKEVNRYEYSITASITQNRRYTMADIGTLATRIDNLEYYTSLNLLEQATSSLLVKSDDTGLNRFKNGILVDPFAGHDIGDTLDPNYNIAIDANKREMRPKFNQRQEMFEVDLVASQNIVQVGDLVLLDYNEVPYISQSYASKYRNCIEGNIFVWKTNVTLIPNYQTSVDLQKGPDVVGSLDMSANWINLKNAWGTQWGNWETIGSTVSQPVSSKTLNSSTTDNFGNVSKTYTERTTTTTAERQKQTGTQLEISGYNESKIDLGTYVTDVSILPYISSITIKFNALGLKPGSKVYAYFNNVAVSDWCYPCRSDYTYNRASVYYGAPLIVGDDGSIYGFFTIPPNKFQASELTFMLCDVDNLTTGSSSISTQATGIYYANKLSVAKGSSSLNTREPVLAVHEVTQEKDVLTTVNVDKATTEITPGKALTPVVIHIKPGVDVTYWAADGDGVVTVGGDGDGDDGDDGCGCDSDTSDCDDDDDDDDDDD